jgi:hypothetical protein
MGSLCGELAAIVVRPPATIVEQANNISVSTPLKVGIVMSDAS